mgnify:CR=1 FL=1
MNQDYKEQRRESAERAIKLMIGEQSSKDWWTRPNRAFNGLTPDEMWEQDDEPVRSYILSCLVR